MDHVLEVGGWVGRNVLSVMASFIALLPVPTDWRAMGR